MDIDRMIKALQDIRDLAQDIGDDTTAYENDSFRELSDIAREGLGQKPKNGRLDRRGIDDMLAKIRLEK